MRHRNWLARRIAQDFADLPAPLRAAIPGRSRRYPTGSRTSNGGRYINTSMPIPPISPTVAAPASSPVSSPVSSMTGFARAAVELNGRVNYSLTIKSVNHRFLDLHLRLPSGLDALEMELRRVL